ncbi:MAG TPA: radical SAM protein [Terriglobales bacterium]|nr:radical SAM protein [Terriglobales bacterium]
MMMRVPGQGASARELLEAARPWLREAFVLEGLLRNRVDHEEFATWMERGARLLDGLARHPFGRLRDLAAASRCDAQEFASLMSALLSEESVRAFVSEASDSAYRRNTIQPIIDTGAFDAVVEGRYRYPFTVGIYPAVSCMLSCNFCGRVPHAEYKWSQVERGNELLREVFAQAPTDAPGRFYISGGLEPLTNPGLDKLVRFAAGRGFKLQLYTNAMMLTRSFLEKHEGLWDLDTIRISLYGADDAMTEQTTKRAGVASRVIANAKEFVQFRSEVKATTRLAFNYVVQSGQVRHLREIGRLVAEIAEQGEDSGSIAFLSLRENYAASGDTAVCGEEREQLRDELFALGQFFSERGLSDLTIDFGYAMEGLMKGRETGPVHRVTHQEMCERGYPQISVVVDLLGDIYLYREAAFLGRKGADRYIIGRLGRDGSFEQILERYIAEGHQGVRPAPGDELFLDAFDHAVTAYLRQVSDDMAFTAELAPLPERVELGVAPPVRNTLWASHNVRSIREKYVPPLAIGS